MRKTNFINTLFKDTEGLIEIREIDKQGAKNYFFSPKEFKNYTIPLNKNVYYGVFTRNKRNGKAINCNTTGTLWADYDGIKLQETKERILKAGLPKPSIIINSGHGIHTYWILDKRAADVTDILKAISNKTGSDPRATDKARIMRLPGSINVKDRPLKCEILEKNNDIYSIDLFKKLFNSEIEPKGIEVKAPSITPGEKLPKELINCNMACIKVMAQGVEQHYRNFAMVKIMQFLKIKGYSRSRNLEVIKQINARNKPPKEENELINEFNFAYDKDYKFLSCNFTDIDLQEKQKKFCSMGNCKYHLQQSISIENAKESTSIDNKIFRDTVYPKIKGITLAIYFTISRAGEQGIGREHLYNLLDRHLKDKTIPEAINELKELEFITVEKVATHKQGAFKKIYKVNDLSNYGRGYTLVNSLLSEIFLANYNAKSDNLKRLTDTEYKLLILLKSYAYGKETVYPTEETLAAKMGIEENTIKKVLNKLEYKLYIERHLKPLDNGKTKLYITLKF